VADRQPYGGMTPEEIDSLAERAAEKALAKVYADIGQSVLKRIAWIAGVAVVSLVIFLAGKDALIK